MSLPIGNVGALPVFRSVADVPAWAVYRGVDFVLPDAGGLGVYRATAPDGLNGWLSSLVKIGGVVAAPFTGGLSIPVSNAAAGAIDQKQAQGQQAKAIGAQFDQEAARVTQLFNSIQSKAVITPADYATAANAYNQLAAGVAQSSSITWIVNKWADPSYNAAYLSRLEQIKTAAQATATGASSSTGASLGVIASADAGLTDNTKLLIGAAAVGLALILVTR